MARRTDRWGIGALVALALVGAAACGSDGDGDAATTAPASSAPPTTQAPPSTAAATTEAPTTTEAAVTSTTAEPSRHGVPLEEWIAAQEAEGRTDGYTKPGIATDASIVVAMDEGGSDPVAGLLLADRTVIDLPDDAPFDTSPAVGSIGDRLAVVASLREVGWVVWRLEDDRTWSDRVDLGVVGIGTVYVDSLGDHLAVATQSTRDGDNGWYVPDGFAGVLVDADLAVTPMATIPDGQFLWVTSTVGSHALMLGLDSAADANAPLTQPWDFDASTNTWTAVPQPDWLGCAPGCNWMAPHEWVDFHLEVVVGDRVVMRLPDGSIGQYRPATAEWTRLQDAPFELSGPTVAVLGDQVVVAPVVTGFGENRPGTVGVLDLAAGAWIVDEVDVGEIPDNGYQEWEVRVDGDVALFDVIHPELLDQDPSAAEVAYDATTREWRIPTADEAAAWDDLPCLSCGPAPLRDLLA